MQGDGEVCVTALETSLVGDFRLTVRKDLGVAGAANGTSWVPLGVERPRQVQRARTRRRYAAATEAAGKVHVCACSGLGAV